MRHENGRGTTNLKFRDDVPAVETTRSRRRTTTRVLKFPTSGTSALRPQEIEDETNFENLPVIPEEVTYPKVSRGKSLAQWGIERRRAAKALTEQWQNEISPTVGTPAFAVRASGFLDTINSLIQLYTGIDYEEIFAGLLQLVRDALVGQNFVVAEEGRLDEPIQNVLKIAIDSKDLSMASYDEALEKFINAGFQTGQNG